MTMQPFIRWMVRRDMLEVLAIEADCFPGRAWNEEDFLSHLRQRNCIGMIADAEETVVGFMVYELLKSELHVINFAVAPSARRNGVGSAMVDKLKAKLQQQRRTSVKVVVREANLAAQLFFRANLFAAERVLRGHYDDSDEDGYLLRFTLGAEPVGKFSPVNRCKAFLGE